jgi:hypothetical protein
VEPDSSPAEEANRLQQKLIALVRRMAADHGVRDSALDEEIELALTLHLLSANGALAPAPTHTPLFKQLSTQLAECAAETDAFQMGRVYCYRSSSAHGPDTMPPRTSAVFAGYSPTGVPQWRDFHQFLLDEGDERVDQLFADKPITVARVTLGRVLKAAMLPSLGKQSRSYNILGQVTAGYYATPGSDGPRGRQAVTFQIVECRAPRGLFRLELNVIGVTPLGTPVAESMLLGDLPVLTKAYQPARRALQEIEKSVRALPREGGSARKNKLLARVPGLLSRIAEVLGRAQRQSARRTRHAVERRSDQRPVQCAIEDTRKAGSDAFYVDERRKTIAVRGPRNRVHVFSRDARHVTTFTLRDEQIQGRVKRKTWRPATENERSDFLQTLEALVGSTP